MRTIKKGGGGMKEGKGKLDAHAIKGVAAGAHLPTHWLFEPAKRPDDRTDYCLDWMKGIILNTSFSVLFDQNTTERNRHGFTRMSTSIMII